MQVFHTPVTSLECVTGHFHSRLVLQSNLDEREILKEAFLIRKQETNLINLMLQERKSVPLCYLVPKKKTSLKENFV